MLEKLKKPKSINWDNDVDSCIQRHEIIADTIDKVNEIVEAVNEFQAKVNKIEEKVNFAQPEVKENTQDKFAEQKRWIGKLCRFWFEHKKQSYFGILGDIEEDEIHPYFNADLGCNYKCCEPVKPDDDIIYKKENEFTYQEIIIGDMH